MLLMYLLIKEKKKSGGLTWDVEKLLNEFSVLFVNEKMIFLRQKMGKINSLMFVLKAI
jgi:hypothetical protein